MHTIKLKVGDRIYNHIMFILKNLSSEELEIIEEDKEYQKDRNLIDFSKYKIKSFDNVKDPVKWQRAIRDEWS